MYHDFPDYMAKRPSNNQPFDCTTFVWQYIRTQDGNVLPRLFSCSNYSYCTPHRAAVGTVRAAQRATQPWGEILIRRNTIKICYGTILKLFGHDVFPDRQR